MRDFLLLHFFGLSSFGEYWTENITERTRIEFVRNNFLNCKVNVLRNQYAFCEPNVERSPIRVTHFQLPSITRKSIQYVVSMCRIIRRTHVVDGTAFVLLLQLLLGDNYKSTGVKRILRRTRYNGWNTDSFITWDMFWVSSPERVAVSHSKRDILLRVFRVSCVSSHLVYLLFYGCGSEFTLDYLRLKQSWCSCQRKGKSKNRRDLNNNICTRQRPCKTLTSAEPLTSAVRWNRVAALIAGVGVFSPPPALPRSTYCILEVITSAR